MPGFPREEQRLLARLVGAHRRKLTLDRIEELVPPWDKQRACTSSCCCASRCCCTAAAAPTALPTIELAATPKSLEVRFPARWLKEHPLTSADLQQEVQYLRASGFRLRVFSRGR